MTSTTPASDAVVRLDLSAGSIHTTLHEGKPHIVVRAAVEDLGLSYPAQYRKLQGRSWATVAQKATVADDGKVREMDVVPVRTFLMLLATINENRVAPAARPVLVAYQNETADAIEAYWTRGHATNPRGPAEHESPTTVSWDQAAAIARIQYGLDVDPNEFRELLNKGGILKNTLAPHKKWEHLFWPLASRWEIHAHVLPQLIHFAVKVQRELAAAEQDLQMSLPLPLSALMPEQVGPRRSGSVLQLPRQTRGDAS